MSAIVTVCLAGGAAAALEAATHNAPAAATLAKATRDILPPSLLPELRLELLRMLQVAVDRGAHLLDQGLQLGVLRARDERLVDRVENLLVISDLLVDVRLVERGALER